MKVCAFVCMKFPLKKNDIDLMEKKPKMGFFNRKLHKILEYFAFFLECFVFLYNILYTKDSRILEYILESYGKLHFNSRMFCSSLGGFINA